MRDLLALSLALLPLVQAQDSPLRKSVDPRYDAYNQELAVDFVAANASVTMTVLANGKPLSLDKSSVPLPTAVVMALKDYEFRPQGTIPHGQPETEGDTYQVTVSIPIRQSSVGESPSIIRVGPAIAKGLLVKQVAPEPSEFARHNRLRGTITFETVIGKQGEVERLTPSGGPFALIEAAYEAVKQWEFRPYLLNHEPVEWRTEISVSFNSN